jgi:hypothetical protein
VPVRVSAFPYEGVLAAKTCTDFGHQLPITIYPQSRPVLEQESKCIVLQAAANPKVDKYLVAHLDSVEDLIDYPVFVALRMHLVTVPNQTLRLVMPRCHPELSFAAGF